MTVKSVAPTTECLTWDNTQLTFLPPKEPVVWDNTQLTYDLSIRKVNSVLKGMRQDFSEDMYDLMDKVQNYKADNPFFIKKPQGYLLGKFTFITSQEHKACFPTAFVSELFVYPQFREQGIGGSLLRVVQKFAYRQHLIVLLGCPLHRRSFYKQLGFREVVASHKSASMVWNVTEPEYTILVELLS